MPNLQWISLEHCPVDLIPPGAFVCVPKLKRLEIRHSLLSNCVSLSELTNLETLDLSFNQITSVSMLTASLPRQFMNTTLKVLGLGCNQLCSLDAHAFDQLSALTILDLTRNDIKTIERGAFSGLRNLQELLLNQNKLSEPFDLSLVFDPELVNLRAVDLATTYGRRQELFQEVTFKGDLKKIFASFKHTVSLFLDSSRLSSGGEIISELKKLCHIYQHYRRIKKINLYISD
jgi:hypothetical protein